MVGINILPHLYSMYSVDNACTRCDIENVPNVETQTLRDLANKNACIQTTLVQ